MINKEQASVTLSARPSFVLLSSATYAGYKLLESDARLEALEGDRYLHAVAWCGRLEMGAKGSVH